MALYELGKEALRLLERTSLHLESVRERQDLQRLLRDQISVLDPDLLVIAEEFGYWQDSRRRIDLLAVDRAANLVVIELKRDDSGAHMELQALRYAAMVSTMTWSGAVEAFGTYLRARDRESDPSETLLDFLGWDEPDDESFGQDVRIILAAADFSRELTTAVLWLNQRELDIRCVRLQPFSDGARVLLNVQQAIPLPEAEDFQVQIREKARQERQARTQNRDTTRFDLDVGGASHTGLPKRVAGFLVASYLVRKGVSPERVAEAALPRSFEQVFAVAEGKLDEDAFIAAVDRTRRAAGKSFDAPRWFTADDELMSCDGKTYAFSKMWGGPRWHAMMHRWEEAYPEAHISLSPSRQ